MKRFWSVTLSSIIVLLVSWLIACGGSGSSNGPVTAVIGSDGGSITSADGKLTLDVPAGALTEDTTITVHVRQSSISSLMFYEMLPAGLVFQMPARMTIDVSSVMAESDASSLRAESAPLIVTANVAGDAFEALESPLLTMNADTNHFLLSGDVTHFSRFVIGGNLGLSGSIENVPQFAQANASFGPVNPVVNFSPLPETRLPQISSIHYNDASEAPVLYGNTGITFLTPAPMANESQTYSVPYVCGDPGVGTFNGSVTIFAGVGELVTVYTPEEINIAAAFIFSPEAVTGGESRFEFRVISRPYTLSGSRQVNCGGSEPAETPDPTVEPTAEPTAEATPEPTGEPTAEPTVAPTSGTPPVIQSSSSEIRINHTRGQTECPTLAEPFIVSTEDGRDVLITITEDLPFLNVPGPTSTSNGQLSIQASFPCSGFSPGENRGTISIFGEDPQTGQMSNTFPVSVVVTVN